MKRRLPTPGTEAHFNIASILRSKCLLDSPTVINLPGDAFKHDVMGDIHGHADELEQLLAKLGYPDRLVLAVQRRAGDRNRFYLAAMGQLRSHTDRIDDRSDVGNSLLQFEGPSDERQRQD